VTDLIVLGVLLLFGLLALVILGPIRQDHKRQDERRERWERSSPTSPDQPEARER
jgi:hypothetical protein